MEQPTMKASSAVKWLSVRLISSATIESY